MPASSSVMKPGPTTVRANEPLQALVDRMAKSDVPSILVSDPDGVLLGMFKRRTPDASSGLGPPKQLNPELPAALRARCL